LGLTGFSLLSIRRFDGLYRALTGPKAPLWSYHAF
jgi:hypothetical protein